MNSDILINDYLVKQEFESDYFGFNIYKLKGLNKINEVILKEIIQLASRKNIQLITCLVNPINRTLIKLLKKLGFALQNIKVTYSKNISDTPTPHIGLQEIDITNDLKYLRLIAKKSFLFSRVFNNYFPEKKSKYWYAAWLTNSIDKPNKIILVVKWKNIPSGFIICKKRKTVGIIELIAINRAVQNKGLGTNLILQSIKWFKKNKINKISVSTQAENLRSQIFYQKLGFIISNIKTWHYKSV